MKLPFRRGPSEERSRGQAMVEFALILPVLVLLLVLAIDFGRVFFGYVALNNAARIAANAAALEPDAWDGTGTTAEQDAYRDEVVRDLQSINCVPPSGTAWARADIPDPTFTDLAGTADPYEIGDRVTVALTCNLSFVTPLVGAIVGSPFTFTAEADFAVRGGVINGVPVGGTLPAPPSCVDAVVPNMVGMSVGAARTTWFGQGFNPGTFNPATGQDTESVSAQNTTPPSSVGDCLPKSATVTVTSTTPVTCTAPDILVPTMVGGTVDAARTTWQGAGFDVANFNPNVGFGTDRVDSQSIPGNTCELATVTITVVHSTPPPPPPATCPMPQLVGLKVNNAEAPWRTAGFTTGSFIKAPGNGNYDVQFQSLVGGQSYPCDEDVTVGPVSQP